MGLVRVASRAGELPEVETEPEGVDEGPVHLHAAVVAEITLLEHRFSDVAEMSKNKNQNCNPPSLFFFAGQNLLLNNIV